MGGGGSHGRLLGARIEVAGLSHSHTWVKRCWDTWFLAGRPQLRDRARRKGKTCLW